MCCRTRPWRLAAAVADVRGVPLPHLGHYPLLWDGAAGHTACASASRRYTMDAERPPMSELVMGGDAQPASESDSKVKKKVKRPFDFNK